MSEFEQEPEGESESESADPAASEQEAGASKRAPGRASEEGMGPGEADLSAFEEGEEDDGEGLGRPGLAGAVSLADHDLRAALEALILVSDKPVAAVRLARLSR